ncbi:hypothetical protein Micbo1qcDRAFT_162727 [Microdochium bolleyi]|uniref:Secreted protein n=1 Tax=Microdochium bolleyi TaxID=196109 RepID=A0A136J5H5_9PEZI|nr:hypothetical protein Micbo1qcDRAFT_162727 [Microdochium bolleyi]
MGTGQIDAFFLLVLISGVMSKQACEHFWVWKRGSCWLFSRVRISFGLFACLFALSPWQPCMPCSPQCQLGASPSDACGCILARQTMRPAIERSALHCCACRYMYCSDLYLLENGRR